MAYNIYPSAEGYTPAEYNINNCYTVEELAMQNAYLSAETFLHDKIVDDWFMDDLLEGICERDGFDYDEAWLMTRVLFEPAVYYHLTGKVK
jgi:hypothetical protein